MCCLLEMLRGIAMMFHLVEVPLSIEVRKRIVRRTRGEVLLNSEILRVNNDYNNRTISLHTCGAVEDLKSSYKKGRQYVFF